MVPAANSKKMMIDMNDLKNKLILLTGGTGFIGSSLIPRLTSAGARVYCMGRSPSKFETLTHHLKSMGIAQDVISDQLRFIKCDLADPDSIKGNSKVLKDVDILVHLASEVSGQRDIVNGGPAQVDMELKGTLRLLNQIPHLDRVCYASSMAVYGTPLDNPVTEATRTEPENIYGICKLIMEKFFRLFSEHEGIPVGVVRFSSVYGPGNTSRRAIPTFIRKLLAGEGVTVYGDGTQLRDYVFVDDAAEAVIMMLAKKGFNIYNIGAGFGTSTNDLLDTLKKLTGKSVEVEYKPLPDPAVTFDFVYDISKAREELGFEPHTGLEDGLKRELDWHIGQPDH